MNNKIHYASKRLNLLKEEMGAIKGIFSGNGTLFIELENGMNLQLHDHEIRHQAIDYLKSELDSIEDS